MQHLFVYVTAPSKDEGLRLSRALVEERLAACANLLDAVQSVYQWQGQVETAQECVCVFKTTSVLYPALEKRLLELHPYEVPCIVALPVIRGAEAFLRWIETETAPRNP